MPEVRAAVRSHLAHKARARSWEGQPEAVAVQAQESLEELSTLKVKTVEVRRCPSSKVRHSHCALLEQP